MRFRGLRWVLSCVLPLALIGCSTTPSTTGSGPIGSSRYSGSVHGGQQPVAGATIQLYTVGTTGDGSAAIPLLTSTVTSDASGGFSITGLYSCANATQVYIVATGGNPGLTATNPNIALMAALGPCTSLTSSTFISINELTTVSAVSALGPYMSSISAIGSSSSDATSLTAAFTLANELVDTSTGTSPGANVPSGFTVPTAELNTLADILSACVNSAGGSAGDGSLCGSLFTLTTVGANPAPTNTIAALLNIASNPSQNVASLFALTPPTPPFQPTLTASPSSLQIQLIPSAGGAYLLMSPAAINFPDTAVGSTSLAQTVTIENPGSSFIGINGFDFGGVDGSDFVVVNPSCGTGLNAGSSCTVQVEAKPSTTGARTGALYVDEGQTSPQYVSLSVNGINPTPPPAGSVTLTSSASFTILGALQDLTLSNLSNVPLAISSITESDSGPANHPYFTITGNNCGTSLPAQSVCTITVASTYSPPLEYSAATYTGTVTVNDNAASGSQTASLTSTDTYYIAVTAPAVFSFGAEPVGYTQTTTNATVYGPWAPGAIAPAIPLTISGSDASDFAISTTDPAQPASPGTGCMDTYNGETSICEISVSFTPSAAGQRTAKVSLDSSGTPSGQYMLLEGTGNAPGPSFTVNGSFTVGNYLPGNIDPNSLAPSTVTLTNNGTTTVKLGASFTGAAAPYLSVSAANCASVAPQATCQFTISFNSPTVGNYQGTVVLNDANSTFSLPVAVTGVTANWSPVAAPNYISFGNEAVGSMSASKTFTIADPYGYPLGHPYSVSLQQSSNFVLTQGSTCPASTTQICTLAVAFAPLANGSVNEYATITDQTTGLQSQLNLVGTGGGPNYTLSTNSVTFPLRSVNTTSVPTVVTLTSSGTQTLAVSNISISGVVNNNFSETNNCGSVPVNSTCSINITFAPTTAGQQSATLQITSNAVSSASSISLSGSAQ